MIQVDKVTRDVGSFKLDNISFESPDGEYLVVLGPSGAGKTMLLESIAGLVSIDSGKIFINGKDVTKLPPERRNVGFVYQDYMLFPNMTVEENIAFGLAMHDTPKSERDRRVQEMMEFLGIDYLKGRRPRTLSGGEKQRVALARALIINPEVLLLDEPLSSLDAQVRKKLREDLKKIHEKHPVNVIHVTHDQIEAFVLADRIGVLSQGRLLELGTPEEIFKKPKTEFTTKFVGFDNVFKGRAKRENGITLVQVGDLVFQVISKKKGTITFAFRPEDVIVSREKLKSSARNQFTGKITEIIDEGPLVRLKINVSDIIISAIITKKSFVDMNLRHGDIVTFIVKTTSIHVL